MAEGDRSKITVRVKRLEPTVCGSALAKDLRGRIAPRTRTIIARKSEARIFMTGFYRAVKPSPARGDLEVQRASSLTILESILKLCYVISLLPLLLDCEPAKFLNRYVELDFLDSFARHFVH